MSKKKPRHEPTLFLLTLGKKLFIKRIEIGGEIQEALPKDWQWK